MPTANERRALWFLAIVALSGTVVRLARSRPSAGSMEPDPQIAHQLARVDSARERRWAKAQAPRRDGRSPAAGSRPDPLDLDRASAAQIESLPGIGPALAARIVAHRDSIAGFGTFGAFCRVRGVGPALINRLKGRVVIGGLAADGSDCDRAAERPSASRATKRGRSR